MTTEISNQHHSSALSIHQTFSSQENQQKTSIENVTLHHREKSSLEEKKDLKLLVKELNDVSKAVNSKRLQFVIDQESNNIIVKIIDIDTDKVIKELPEKALQKLHKSIREAVGLLIDELI